MLVISEDVVVQATNALEPALYLGQLGIEAIGTVLEGLTDKRGP